MSLVRSLGHALLSAVFITGGAQAFLEPGGRPKLVEKAGIPEPESAVILNGAVMVVGGAALATGLFPRVAAAVLLGSLIPTTIVGHAYWNETDPKMHHNQRTQFMKNLGLMGALVLVVVEK